MAVADMDDIAVDQDDVAADDCPGKFSDTAESSYFFAVSVDNEHRRVVAAAPTTMRRPDRSVCNMLLSLL